MATYAIAVFLVGMILLLGWLYVTSENPRSGALLGKSLLLFALPIVIWPAWLFHFTFGTWAAAASEEGLKAFASTREIRQKDKFWLVSLFGIWELTLDKPFWSLALSHSGQSWSRLSLIALIYTTALPVLMHTVTAAIYAFTFEQRLWVAWLASCAVHIGFNETVDHLSASPMVVLAQTIILAATLGALASKRRRSAAE